MAYRRLRSFHLIWAKFPHQANIEQLLKPWPLVLLADSFVCCSLMSINPQNWHWHFCVNFPRHYFRFPMFCKYHPRTKKIKETQTTGIHCSLPKLSVGGRSLCDNRCWRWQSWVKWVITQVKGKRTWTHNGWSGSRACHRLCENFLLTN